MVRKNSNNLLIKTYHNNIVIKYKKIITKEVLTIIIMDNLKIAFVRFISSLFINCGNFSNISHKLFNYFDNSVVQQLQLLK